MDAVEFIKERNRMCDSVDSCSKCQVYDELKQCDFCTEDPEKLVRIVEQWSKEQPQKTVMQDFFEKFPNAPKTMLGYPYPCAKDLGYPKSDSCSFGLKNTPGANCRACWSRPMED